MLRREGRRESAWECLRESGMIVGPKQLGSDTPLSVLPIVSSASTMAGQRMMTGFHGQNSSVALADLT